MNAAPPVVVALAASLLPGRAVALLSRHPAVDPEACRSLLAAPRSERLAALALALRSGVQPGVRAADTPAPLPGEDPAGEPPAWPVLQPGDVLPFELPAVATSLTEVDASVLDLGVRAARSAALGISSVLGGEAVVRGRLLPGLPEPAGTALVPVELTALAGMATLAVDRAFAARLAGRVAGGAGPTGAAGPLSEAERGVVELAILGALDALAAETEIEAALAPRLALRGGTPVRPICVELTVSAAGTRGRAFLFLPEAALRALPRASQVSPVLEDVPVRGSVRNGQVALDPGELAALQPGDVLLLDPPACESAALQLPGGLSARGRVAGDSLEVEEVTVPGAGRVAGTAPVLLEVELATVAVSLRDLARLAPGAVLPLGIDRSGRVTLRIGERAVARGELVEVDGTVGVRIGALLEQP